MLAKFDDWETKVYLLIKFMENVKYSYINWVRRLIFIFCVKILRIRIFSVEIEILKHLKLLKYT